MTKVLHRSGKITEFDVNKIRVVVEWSCQNLASPIELEAAFSANLKDEIATTEIQGNLIARALALCTPDAPNWTYVAGRLHIWDLWKTIRAARLYDQGDVYNTSVRAIKDKLSKNIYNPVILHEYTLEEIEIACNWINPEYDRDYDYAGAKLLTNRYLISNELPQECFLISALLLAINHQGNRLAFAKQVYLAIAQRKI